MVNLAAGMKCRVAAIKRLPVLHHSADYIAAYEETYYNRVSDFCPFVCSLIFQMQTFRFSFYFNVAGVKCREAAIKQTESPTFLLLCILFFFFFFFFFFFIFFFFFFIFFSFLFYYYYYFFSERQTFRFLLVWLNLDNNE